MLSSSESDSFSGRHATPWQSVDDPSPGLSKVHSNHSTASAMHRQNSNQRSSQSFSENPSVNPSYFSAPSAAMGPLSKQTQTPFLDPTTSNFVTSNIFDSSSRISRHNSDEETRPTAKSLGFGGLDSGLSIQSGRQNYYTGLSGQHSKAASRSGSMPPSRHEIQQPASRFVDENTRQQNPNLGSIPTHRPNLSTQGPMYPSNGIPVNQRFSNHSNSADLSNVAANFDKLSLTRGNDLVYSQQNRDVQHLNEQFNDLDYVRQANINNNNEMWAMDDTAYLGNQAFSPEGLLPSSMQSNEQTYRNSSYGPSYSHSPSNSEARRSQHSPYYSSVGTPSSFQQRAPSRGSFNGNVAPGQAALLDRKLRGLQQEQQGYLAGHPNPLHYRHPMPQQYDFHPQHALRMNPLAPYYHMPPMPNLLTPPIPRGPARDQDIGQHLRSALLEEFRSNSKTNKRYELKVRRCARVPQPVTDISRTSTTISLSSAATSTDRGSFS